MKQPVFKNVAKRLRVQPHKEEESPRLRSVKEVTQELRYESPTKPGNVMCMDCRCGGYNCPGMPRGYEESLMRNW